MRVSVFEDDPGFKNWAQGKPFRVFIDGVETRCVFTADEEMAMAVVADLGPNGELQLNHAKDEVMRRTVLASSVRIEPVQ